MGSAVLAKAQGQELHILLGTMSDEQQDLNV